MSLLNTKRLAVAMLTAMFILAPAAGAHADSPQFDLIKDQVTLPAISISNVPIFNGTNGISDTVGQIFVGDHVTVSPVQDAEYTGWRAVRAADGSEGVLTSAGFVVLLPKGATTYTSRVQIIELKASGGLVGGIGTTDMHGIKKAPSNSAATVRDSLVGEVFEAAEATVNGPDIMFSESAWRGIKIKDGAIGYVRAKVAQPLKPGEQPAASASAPASAAEDVPADFTETVSVKKGVKLMDRAASDGKSSENLTTVEVPATTAFGADGTQWRAVDFDSTTYFIKDTDAKLVGPGSKSGMKDKLNEMSNGDSTAAPMAPGSDQPAAEDAGLWQKTKDFFTGKKAAATAALELPQLIAAGILSFFALLAAARAGKRVVGQIAGAASGALAAGAAVVFPASAPGWAELTLLAVAVIAAVAVCVAVGRGRGLSALRSPMALAVTAGAGAAAFIVATIAVRPVSAAGALAVICMGLTAANAAPLMSSMPFPDFARRGDSLTTDSDEEQGAPVKPEQERTPWSEEPEARPLARAGAPGRVKLALPKTDDEEL